MGEDSQGTVCGFQSFHQSIHCNVWRWEILIDHRYPGISTNEVFGRRLDKRREAMLNMPRMIQKWKEVRHGHVMNLCVRLFSANSSCNSVDMDVVGKSGPNNYESIFQVAG